MTDKQKADITVFVCAEQKKNNNEITYELQKKKRKNILKYIEMFVRVSLCRRYYFAQAVIFRLSTLLLRASHATH